MVDSTSFWWTFWTVCFATAGGSFTLIAAVVAWRGLADLREFIAFLRLAR